MHVSVNRKPCSFSLNLTGFLQCEPTVLELSELGGSADWSQGREERRTTARKRPSLPISSRKLATYAGMGGGNPRTRSAHLSGTQRRVVRSRDTDTKAPGGYRLHTRPRTSSSWPGSEQLSRYLAAPLAMALVGPAPGTQAQREISSQGWPGVRPSAACEGPAGEGPLRTGRAREPARKGDGKGERRTGRVTQQP